MGKAILTEYSGSTGQQPLWRRGRSAEELRGEVPRQEPARAEPRGDAGGPRDPRDGHCEGGPMRD